MDKPISEKGCEETAGDVATLNRRIQQADHELAQSNLKLQETENLFQLLTDQLILGIVIIQDDRVIFANKGLAELCGYSIEEMKSWPPRGFARVIHPDYLGWVMEFNTRRQEGEFDITARKEVRIVTKQGRVRPLEVFSRTVTYAGRFANLISLIDIEARKKAEEELQQLNQELELRVQERTSQLEYANQELTAFAYSVSHDLRAPLRSINGYADLLGEKYAQLLPEAGRQYLNRLRHAGTQMNALIEDFLRLSRVTRSELRPQQVDLSALAQDIRRELSERFPKRKIIFIAAEGLRVSGDPALLRIALENLLENAWKYTSRLEEARIEFGQRVLDGNPVYFVRDNGTGFDMKYAEKLFGPFQRLHSAEEFEGTGIGLAIVKSVILRHGGRVWAESAPGQGTTFYFVLA